MKHIKTFESFVSEAANVLISPEAKISLNMKKAKENIGDLKDAMSETPEKRVIIAAKLGVELTKLNAIEAQKELLAAKEFEEARVAREKVQKLKDKAAAIADKKTAAAKLKIQTK